MTTELHLTITSDSAIDALVQLIEIGQRAAKELAVAPQPQDIAEAEPPEPQAKGNGNGAGIPVAKKRVRPVGPQSRNEIIKGLTEIFITGAPEIRERIVAFRDSHGAQRLWELKDDALPGAAKLFDELSGLSQP
jgi:hypothetical protein